MEDKKKVLNCTNNIAEKVLQCAESIVDEATSTIIKQTEACDDTSIEEFKIKQNVKNEVLYPLYLKEELLENPKSSKSKETFPSFIVPEIIIQNPSPTSSVSGEEDMQTNTSFHQLLMDTSVSGSQHGESQFDKRSSETTYNKTLDHLHSITKFSIDDDDIDKESSYHQLIIESSESPHGQNQYGKRTLESSNPTYNKIIDHLDDSINKLLIDDDIDKESSSHQLIIDTSGAPHGVNHYDKESSDTTHNDIVDYLHDSSKLSNDDGIDKESSSHPLIIDTSRSSQGQYDKRTSESSDSIHNKAVDFLHDRLYALSTDYNDFFTEHESINNHREFNLDSTKPQETKESLLTELEEKFGEQCVILDSGDSSKFEYDCDKLSLKKSTKFCCYGNTQNFFPSSTSLNHLQIDYLELPDDRNTHHDEASLESTNNSDIEADYVHNPVSTNPFTNLFHCSTHPSEMILPKVCSPKSSKVELCSLEKDSDLVFNNKGTKLTYETPENCTEPENAILEVENDSPLYETRQYWSNVGLITEKKINRKNFLIDSDEMDSMKNMTPVTVKSIDLNNPKNDFKLASYQEFCEKNSDPSKDSEVNYLSFPKKTDTKKKKTIMARISSSISNIFGFKKNTGSGG